MTVPNVLWLGGGCGAGKTTLARRLAYRFDLRLYPVDAYGYAHEARADAGRFPFMAQQASLDYTTRHVNPTVDERVQGFVRHATERFVMILEDIAALGPGPLIVAEGPSLLPDLVATEVASPRHALWLLPTPEVTARSLGIRAEPKPTSDESDRDRAHRLRLARDAELTNLMAERAEANGLAAVVADGSLTVEESEELVAAHFAPTLAAGPVARTGDERGRIRRAENAVVNAQLDAFHAYLGEHRPADEPPFPYACECATLGCTAVAPLTRSEYEQLGRAVADRH